MKLNKQLNMAAEINKRFLDYDGLVTLWGIIKNKFADKNAAVSTISFEPTSYTPEDETSPVATQALITTMVDGTTKKVVNMPHATRTQAGLMSPEQFTIVDDLEHNIEDMAPFAGLKLGSSTAANEVSLLERKANIELKYMTEADGTGVTNKAFIALVDSNYPEGGSWTESNEAGYNAAVDKTNWHAWRQPNGSYRYYYWSEAGKIGPINALGEPIMAQAITKIDVTELVKTGLLIDSDVVINPEGFAVGTYLKLTFNAYNAADGSSKPQIQYINVTDLVEIYSAGEGISITNEVNTGADDKAHTGVINVVAATDAKLGAIKTGYTVPETTEANTKTYAIELDANNKAYVAVPWNETIVNAGTPVTDKDVDGNPYLVVSCTPNAVTSDTDGSTTTTYSISVAVGEGIKNAESLARTAVQKIEGDDGYININAGTGYTDGKPIDLNKKGTQWSVSLDQTVKDSLTLADSAVQSIAAAQFNDSDRPQGSADEDDIIVTASDDADQKGKKTYTIALGERTKKSLNLADSALQEITIMGTKLNENDSIYTATEAKKVLALGSAAGVNIDDDGELKTFESEIIYVEEGAVGTNKTAVVKNVPTVEAVKTYVDETAASTETAYENLIKATVESLDSSTTAGVVGAAYTAQNVEAKRIFTKVVIKDGKLVTPDAAEGDETHGKSIVDTIKITDIVDFREMTEAEIIALCV